MDDIKRIYSLLSHSNGLKIRAISQELELDKYYVAEIMFSSQNIPYWYQDDNSLWYAKEGALQIEEPEEENDELIAPVEIPQRFNVNRFLAENLSDSLRFYLSQISKYRIYSNDEMMELFKRYRNGDQKAFDLIIKSQQRLVANIALLYCRKGAPLEDIIQEGNVGLVKAAERFDYTQYRSFSNYAKAWILQSISISMTTMPYMVRLPLNQLVADYEKDEYNWHFVRWLLRCLNNKEALILRLYYGIDVMEETLSSIGDKMDLTRERVRQIIWSSVRKLQDVSHIKIEEAKIGEIIRIDSSNQLGRVVKTKQGADGSTILIVKMYSGFTTEISVSNTPYHIIKRVKSQEKQKQISNSYQKTSVTEYTHLKQEGRRSLNKETPKEVTKYGELKVGDQILYNRKHCIVKKIIGSSKSAKLFIEYSNGVMDVVSYNRSKIEMLSKSSKMVIERSFSSARTQITNQTKREAMVGDRIKYQSMNCTVIKKKEMRGSFRLIVRYDDGRVDNLLNDRSKYIIIN